MTPCRTYRKYDANATAIVLNDISNLLTLNICVIAHKNKREDFTQLTFPEFHFETEAKVDFPSACI